MKSSTTYSNQQGFALLLIGAPKSGKSCLAGQFPRPYFVDIDNNLGSVRRHLSKLDSTKEFFYDTVTEDAAGKPLDTPFRYEYLTKLVLEACKSDKIDTIVIDSLTTLTDLILSHIMRVNGRTVLQIQDWGTFQQLLLKLVYALRSSGKYIIFTAHEETQKDEVSGIVMYKLSLPGQLKDKLAAYFSDIWHTEVDQKGSEYKFIVRTMPTVRIALGNSLSLPPTFEFSWDVLKKALEAGNTPVPVTEVK